MHAQDALFNDGTDWHEVEAYSKLAPELDRVPTFAFVEEPISPVYCLALVVSSQKVHFVWELDFVRKE